MRILPSLMRTGRTFRAVGARPRDWRASARCGRQVRFATRPLRLRCPRPSGRNLRPMLRLAMPVVLAELGWMSMGIVDTIMVAPLGPAAIGAAGIGNAIHIAFAIFGMGLLLGLDTLVSQAYGAGDHRDCHRWLLHGLVLGRPRRRCRSCWSARWSWPPSPPSASIRRWSRSCSGYFGVIVWSTLPLLLYAALRRYLQGIHAVMPVAFALVTANLVNAATNVLLIYGGAGLPALGVPGAAWATVASRLYMLAVLWLAVRYYDRVRDSGFQAVSRHISRLRLVRLCQLGLPGRAADLDRSHRLRAGHGASWPARPGVERLASDRAQHRRDRLHGAARHRVRRGGAGRQPRRRRRPAGRRTGRLDGARARRRVHERRLAAVHDDAAHLHRRVLARPGRCSLWGRRCC